MSRAIDQHKTRRASDIEQLATSFKIKSKLDCEISQRRAAVMFDYQTSNAGAPRIHTGGPKILAKNSAPALDIMSNTSSQNPTANVRVPAGGSKVRKVQSSAFVRGHTRDTEPSNKLGANTRIN